jgi:predicted neuraminidase
VRALGAALIVAITFWAAWPLSPVPSPGFVLPPAGAMETRKEDTVPRFSSAVLNAAHPPRVHAASIVEWPDKRLFAVWFGGAREGSSDVRIYGASGAPDSGRTLWSEARVITSPNETTASQARWARKLGNPVLLPSPFGREPHMIYVSTTLGGWATSRLNLLDLSGLRPPASSVPLISSPFFNMSTLVKGSPVLFDNGDMGVPVYHEMAGKFPELLVLAPDGRVRRKIRMGHGRRALQPVLVVESATRAIALMRDGSGNPFRVWRSETSDAGRTWTTLESTDLPNPNSAITALGFDEKRLLAVANDTEQDRLRLSLLVSEDRGRHWRVIHRFEDRQSFFEASPAEEKFRALLAADVAALGPGPAPGKIAANAVRNKCKKQGVCSWQYDYPALIRASDGDFHLVYTWNQSFIRHVRFNAAWLRARLEEAK